MVDERFEEMLSGGHPNSLGRTVDVVERVLSDPGRFAELFACYQSDDSVVRLRTSSALKRVEAARHELLVPYIDRLIDEIGGLDQASAQWTLAHLFRRLLDDMTAGQQERAVAIVKRNLAVHDDWIVLDTSVETLAAWAEHDAARRLWLEPHLERLSADTRKSVAGRARKTRRRLYSAVPE